MPYLLVTKGDGTCLGLDRCPPGLEALLESLFVRLKLKERPFEVFHAASSAELDAFWNHILRIDARLTRQDHSKAVLDEQPGLPLALLPGTCIFIQYQKVW